jgi:hypothetical protein
METWVRPEEKAALADVGPRTGDGETQGLYGGHGCKSLLLRSAESLAARHERKYHSVVTAILSQIMQSRSMRNLMV